MNSWGLGSSPSSPSSSTRSFSSIVRPRPAKSTPNSSNSSGRYPTANTQPTRPPLRWSITEISSARRTGSWSGSTVAATMMKVDVVRAAIAAASGPGDGR